MQSDRQAKRFRAIGVLSHVQAQRAELSNFLQSGMRHLILVRVADDTNIWIQGTNNSEEDASKKTKAKKMVSVLGMCQSLAARRSDHVPLQFVTIHAPSQVLPQANAFTIRHRLQKWSVLSSAGSGKHIQVEDALQQIPIKVIISCNLDLFALNGLCCAWTMPRIEV